MQSLRSFIEAVFDEKYERIAAVRSFRELEDWDSLKYVRLVVAIQTEYGVELTAEEIQRITSVAGIEAVLAAKGIAP